MTVWMTLMYNHKTMIRHPAGLMSMLGVQTMNVAGARAQNYANILTFHIRSRRVVSCCFRCLSKNGQTMDLAPITSRNDT